MFEFIKNLIISNGDIVVAVMVIAILYAIVRRYLRRASVK